MIRTYQAEHGEMVFVSTLTQRQKKLRSRIMALVVILAVGASAGTVQAFNDRDRADVARTWTP